MTAAALSLPSRRPRVNLALQGGGSHGAFTWGVLDALLEDGRLGLEGISGASAGAVNAVALAHGFATADDAADPTRAAARQAARETLERVWRRVSSAGAPGALASQFMRMLFGQTPAFPPLTTDPWASPYQFNPLGINPLRTLLDQEIDFDAVAALDTPRVFVSATQVRTGRAQIFHGAQLTLSAVMASACLPTMFQAVEIDGEPYWDGGYSANPALLPLIENCESADIVLVQLNPLRRAETPRTPHEIAQRVDELAFNASLISQMRSIDFMQQLLADGRLQEGRQFRQLRLHRIDIDSALEDPLPSSTKLSTDIAMIELLFERGRRAALDWLDRHLDDVGRRTTIDIQADYVAGAPLPTEPVADTLPQLRSA
ncbi:patatin-like phospholipase family protein [Pseudacidovorax sp. RU35E]|uniref:patatin-like phospholipase family protein n=1 Tax=Pseudacidovorax sp. RU35E TaxID=1907403 RepID=UPI000957480B|nr:patatin-like phospholipase family protein [Pseudacidovorax sp. RU35E]SIR54557.1 NTE family protein [Pseudacidovorax sp. RU35E]